MPEESPQHSAMCDAVWVPSPIFVYLTTSSPDHYPPCLVVKATQSPQQLSALLRRQRLKLLMESSEFTALLRR
ncbi:MAG: hypothetical protein MK538_12370 [Planctomycetes bacterium]|nr:hypothetical protein [Planctomycetota bacterium]